MESNEHTELTRKMGTDAYTESRTTVGWGILGREEGLNKKRQRTHGHGHGQQYGDC